MRPDAMVVAAPAVDDDLRRAERAEDRPSEKLVTPARIEALDEGSAR
jgi:hypothetical protein